MYQYLEYEINIVYGYKYHDAFNKAVLGVDRFFYKIDKNYKLEQS